MIFFCGQNGLLRFVILIAYAWVLQKLHHYFSGNLFLRNCQIKLFENFSLHFREELFVKKLRCYNEMEGLSWFLSELVSLTTYTKKYRPEFRTVDKKRVTSLNFTT